MFGVLTLTVNKVITLTLPIDLNVKRQFLSAKQLSYFMRISGNDECAIQKYGNSTDSAYFNYVSFGY